MNEPEAGFRQAASLQSVVPFASRSITQNNLVRTEPIALTNKAEELVEVAAPHATEVLTELGNGPISRDLFLTVAEVDQAATPIADWIVPWDVLAKAKVTEFVIRLWIEDSGRVLEAEVLQILPVEASQSVREALTKQLKKTLTNPALKDGRPVASVRTIEVTLEL